MAGGWWSDSDELWGALLPALASPARAKVAERDARALVALLGLSSPVRVVDVGCGAGLHAIELARLGHHVTGLDRTRALLAAARERAAAAGVAADFREGDMRDFALDAPVDVVLSLYVSFGYFETRGEDLAAARAMLRALAPSGRAVLDLAGKEIAGATFAPRSWATFGETTLLEERAILPGWEYVESRWTVLRGGDEERHVVRQRLYSATEIQDLLREAGFARADALGGLDGRAYDRGAERLLVIARRE